MANTTSARNGRHNESRNGHLNDSSGATQPRSIDPSERGLRRLFLLLAIAAAAMAALLALLPPAGHDQLWFLLMAHRWLQGAQLYGPGINGNALFDSNPPAIVWLSTLPALLSRTLHLPVTFVARSFVLLAEAATFFLSLSFLRRIRPATLSPPSPQRAYEPPALLFAAIVLFCIVSARDFGQRDQMLSFLILPYVLAAATTWDRAPLGPAPRHRLSRAAAGILAAIGICLKPHYALIPVAVELTLLLGRQVPNRKLETELGPLAQAPAPGSTASAALPIQPPAEHTPAPTSPLKTLLRPEPILILLIGLAYLAAIRHFTPFYFTLALPILRDTYWAIGHLSLTALALQAVELCILAAIAIALFLLRKPRSQTTLMLLVAAGAATLVYFIQGTGWYYQQLPAIAFFGAALTLELLDILQARANRRPLEPPAWATPAIAALCMLALGLTTYFTGSPFTRTRAYAPIFADPSVPDPAFFASLAPHTPVAILTTSVEAAMMPVQRFHLTWAQRTDNLWLLPAILRSEKPIPNQAPPHKITPANLAALDALQHRWMVEDLSRWRPQLILVDRCQSPQIHCQELEDRHDNLLAWFLRDPAFAALWTHYAYTGTRGAFDAYTLRPPAESLAEPLAVPPPTQ
jgi:hypothetical protein